MPKYYPINEEAAKRAKDMNSFSDYQPGSAMQMHIGTYNGAKQISQYSIPHMDLLSLK